MVIKAVIAGVVLAGLVYLLWGGGASRYDAPRVSGGQTESAAEFNRAFFLEKAQELQPRGMILKAVKGLSDFELRVTMTEKWKALDYEARLKFARAMWEIWEKRFPSATGFKARIVIVDGKERKIGGSRLLNASDIWVRED